MAYVELTNQEKRTAVNSWNRENPDDQLVAKQPGAYRKMLPMIVNGEFTLLCPDSGYETDKIPRKIINNFLNKQEE